ncbi:hypothetical protein LWF15_05340 [Kineosporia rhizophila]|uniref:DUF6758 family protein n=1 Tax=Kineosporia TaxID=49184 RepID=UPI001E57C7DC|nr:MULTISPECIES: DUF6758 family protein [Kineosporia]MCE0534926.1 hypothetical protein [Kineosporia rhizophila]GLY14793.1 hypothetical protein Kisp01_18080 [Kineosporia sp. NBRC 101677]
MTLLRTCPRCGAVAREPGEHTASWTCEEHGPVVPVGPAQAPTQKLIRQVALDSLVPVWMPRPLPQGWEVTGLQWAGAGAGGTVACVVAVSGPHPLPEVGDEEPTVDLMFVAEQPGIGLGAHLAGLRGVDPGPMLADKAAHDPAEIKLEADDHEVPLWSVPVDGGLAYVGEASGVWLWLLAWPSSAALALLNRFCLVDARNEETEPDLPCGPLTPRLR